VIVTKEDAATRQVVLNIQLEPADLERHLSQVYRRLVNRVQIPGFRKGKAPRPVLESFMGREAVVREGLDSILVESLNQAMEEESLEPFGEPEMEVLELDPVSFKAVVPLEPGVDLGNFRELRLQPEAVEVGEEQVGEVLQQLQRSSGVWEPRQGKVRFDDLVTIDVEGTADGRRLAHDQAVDFVPRLDSPLPFPGFSVYLEGMDKGETKEFTLPIPADYADSAIAGKEGRFNVKVLEIKEMKLPELDDEFAKGVGEGYDSLEVLRANLLERLRGDSERRVQIALQEKTLEEVIQGATVEYSALTEGRELSRLVEERAQALREQRLQADAYLRELNKPEEEVREELRPEAVKRLTRFLVVRQVGREEGVEVTQEEVDAEIERMADGLRDSGDSVRQAFSSDDAKGAVRNAIMTRKVMERLAEIAQGSGAPDSKEEDPAQQADDSTIDPERGGSSNGG